MGSSLVPDDGGDDSEAQQLVGETSTFPSPSCLVGFLFWGVEGGFGFFPSNFCVVFPSACPDPASVQVHRDRRLCGREDFSDPPVHRRVLHAELQAYQCVGFSLPLPLSSLFSLPLSSLYLSTSTSTSTSLPFSAASLILPLSEFSSDYLRCC
jgi:hypothetical protein